MIIGRRQLIAGSAGTLALAAVAGCSTSETPATGASSGASMAEMAGTLVFANWQWLEPGRGETLWTGVNKYVSSHPKVTLEKSETPYGQYADKLNTELGAGGGPDIFVVLDSQFATLAEAEILEPLNDAVSSASLNGSNKALVIDGNQLAVTWEQVPYALLGNKVVMDKAGITALPTTVDELIEAGNKIKASGADGFAVRHQMSEFAGWSQDFQNWPYGQGGAWSDGKALTIPADNNVKGVSEFNRVYQSGIMPIGDDASTFRTKFKQNQLGLTIDNSGAALSFASGGAITGKDIISGPLPFPQPGAHLMLVLAVNAKSKNKELAKNFISWFVSQEGQTAVRPGLGASTLATDVPLPADFTEANPWAATYVTIGAKTKSTLIAGFETKTKALLDPIMQGVERVVTQNQDPKASMEQAQNDALPLSK